MKVAIMVFTKKNLFRTNGLFWDRKWHILDFGLALRISFEILQNEMANRFMKILVDFREKFCKASLRICYLSLFECKGP